MRFLVPLILVAGCATPEWVRTYQGSVPGTHRSEASIFLVRDKRTGRPIAGARVRQRQEWMLGRDGHWAPLLAEGVTDEFGLVMFDLEEDPGPCHWTVDAPGYAPAEEYGGTIQPVVELEPGYERSGRILGPTGQPLPGVTMEYKTGCAHAPALRTTRTDGNGTFVFENVLAGDFTFEDPRCEADYWSGFARPRRWGVDSQQALPGAGLRGKVVAEGGSSPDWAAVFCDTSARGPCTAVDSNGYFVLRGVRPGSKLFVFTEDGGATVDTSLYRPEGPILVVLGADSAPPPADVVVAVSLLTDDGAKPDQLCEVFLDRVSDGRRFRAEWSPFQDGPSQLPVEPGEYLLSVGGAWAAYVAEPRPLRADASVSTTVEVHRQPRLHAEVPELEGDPAGRIRLLLLDRYESITREELSNGVHLPDEDAAWLRVDLRGSTYTFPVGPTDRGVRSADVRLPGLKRLVFPGLDAGSQAFLMYAEDAAVDVPASDSTEDSVSLATYAVGDYRVVVMHERRGYAIVPVRLPWSLADPIAIRDLKFVPWPPARELRVVGPDGEPIGGACVEVIEDPTSPPPYDWTNWSGPDTTDEDGVIRNPHFRDGAHVRVDVYGGLLPTWDRLRGEPPYVVKLGGATLELDLRTHPDAVVVFDGRAWLKPEDDGMLVLRGIRAGTHHLLVGEDGQATLAYQLVLREGETRQLRPGLKPLAEGVEDAADPGAGGMPP